MKISVLGAGYVGLTTSACLAQIGHQVFCSDIDMKILSKLREGVMPIFEPHLEGIVRSAAAKGSLIFGSTDKAVGWGDTIFICVGTPPLANGDIDMSAVERVSQTIADHTGYRLVVQKSTVPVLSGVRLRTLIAERSNGRLDFDIASNPEFLREGSAVEDFLHPDRIVVGVESPHAAQRLKEIYSPIIDRRFECPVHSQCRQSQRPRLLITDVNSAELIKQASNSFLAMKVSFINMVANLCESVGADVGDVAEGVGLDPRIGTAFLKPGLGFGGFCLPKDLQGFLRTGEKHGCDFSLLREVEKINQLRISGLVGKACRELDGISGKRISVWGLSFKPNTDDVRFAPSITLLNSLLAEGAVLSAYDPQAENRARALLPQIRYCSSPYEAALRSEAVIIATDWEEFRSINWRHLAGIVDRRLIIDGRNMLKPADVEPYGFRYVSFGRRPVGLSTRVAPVSRVRDGSEQRLQHVPA